MQRMPFPLNGFTPIAHRGLHSKGVPENSMAAFLAAEQAGLAMELDVRLSKDQQLVVFHDDNLERLCGIDTSVIDCDYAALQNYTLLGTAEKIPLLKDVLQQITMPILVEVKPNHPTEYPVIINQLKPLLKPQHSVLCFDRLFLEQSQKAMPHINHCLNMKKYDPLSANMLRFSAGIPINTPIAKPFNGFIWTVKNQQQLELCRQLNMPFAFDGHQVLQEFYNMP